jgi:glycosyltransferase involved in cell wall biosynthesis
MIKDLVSILIPTYDRAAILPEAIDSVLAQTYGPLEAIVIDDGSHDDTAEVVRARYGHDPRVRYVYQDNGGVSSARNRGFREATGEFVAFLDSDDYWYPHKLAAQVAALHALPEVGMIWTDLEAVDPDGRTLHPRYLRRMYQTYRFFPTPEDIFSAELTGDSDAPRIYYGDIFSQMAIGSLVHTSTVLLRRTRADAVGFFREDFRSGEDYEFHLRTCKAGPVAFLDAPTIKYRVESADALTVTNRIGVAEAFLTTLRETLAHDRARIRLPRRIIDETLAEALAWVGSENLARGNAARARSCLARSLYYRPRQFYVVKQLVLALMPVALRGRAVAAFRRLTRGDDARV